MCFKRRLLFVDNSLDSFHAYRMPLAQAARRAGFEVHVAAPSGNCEELIRRGGITFHPVHMSRSGMNPLEELRCIRSLYRLYRRLKPDLIHHLRLKPVLYGGLAAYLARVNAEVSMPTGLGHVFTANTKKARLMRGITLLGCRVAFSHANSKVIFQNPDDMAVFLNANTLEKSQCALIRGSGVDVSGFLVDPEPQGRPLVLLAARMLRDKGIEEFVDAARILRKRGSDARFVLVGDTDPGNPTSVPVQQLESWRDQNLIEWWGYQNDMRSVLAQANIVCLPSYREGVPKVLLEAAAAGRAIVATDVPGCREIVKHGKNGLLVPVRNSAVLAESISFLIDNPLVRSRMARRGRHIAVADFSMDRVITETFRIYSNSLSEKTAALKTVVLEPILKRPLDVVVAALALFFLLPVLLAIAIAIKLDSPGPALYGGIRTGLNNVPFRMWKFRSMITNAERLGGSATAKDDPRITRLGHFLRRYKLDELPQFINVLFGQMSLVGPRPEVRKYTNLLRNEERMILKVRPGITDWASIWNSNEAEVLEGSPDPEATYEKLIRPIKIALQLRYVREVCFAVDCKILCSTAMKLVYSGWVPRELTGIEPVTRYKDLVRV